MRPKQHPERSGDEAPVPFYETDNYSSIEGHTVVKTEISKKGIEESVLGIYIQVSNDVL